jgi:hypothetical protein
VLVRLTGEDRRGRYAWPPGGNPGEVWNLEHDEAAQLIAEGLAVPLTERDRIDLCYGEKR